jgi:S1-C subfamily serine protease
MIMRIAAAAVLSLFLLSPISAQDWSLVTERVEASLVRVTHQGTLQKGQHICAGFVVNELRGNVLTAYHCLLDTNQDTKESKLNPYFQVDGMPSYVVSEFPDDDIVIVALPLLGKPSLDYRRKPLRKGLPVAALGFAYGLPTSTLLTGMIASPEADWGKEGVWLTVDRHSIGGMSGGPMFDEEGRVVGVMQKTDDWTYISRPLSIVLKLTKKFWD